jgi:hypothetical protein
MDYEREKGRIRGHKTSRLKAVEFAKTMIPILAKARIEMPNPSGEGPPKLALAKWLNENNYKTARGKTWRSETVFRLLDTHIGMISSIENEYEIGREALMFAVMHKRYELRDLVISELSEIEKMRESQIIEMWKIQAALNGFKYTDREVPPPINRVFLKRRRNNFHEDKYSLIKNLQQNQTHEEQSPQENSCEEQPQEEQLLLFDELSDPKKG